MRSFLFSVGMIVGLVGCSKTPPAAEVPATPAAPASAASAAVSAPSAPPVASEAPAASAAPDEPHGRMAGGKCEYEDAKGTGTVLEIKDDAAAGGDCKKGPKHVTVKFTPDDPGTKPLQGDPGFTLEVGGMGIVPAGCLAEQKIAVGTKLPVVRHHELHGTCSPLVYEVKALSSPEAIEKCVKYCN